MWISSEQLSYSSSQQKISTVLTPWYKIFKIQKVAELETASIVLESRLMKAGHFDMCLPLAHQQTLTEV